MADVQIDRSLKWYSAREPIVILLLSALAAVSFLAVAGLSRTYHAQQDAIADKSYGHGIADLKAGLPDRAIVEFREALFYSRDNSQYQLSLAEALAARHRTDEAYAYLINLWQREPDNGTVNLELARVFAAKSESAEAIRYYHNAVYAVWAADPEDQRRAVRLEFIDFLLASGSQAQAQSELIALAASLPDDASLHARVGNLFAEARDYEHALAEFRQSLKLDRRNAAAMAGAGRAAFELGRYTQAQRYLESAVSANSNDSTSRSLLRTATLVLQMDPFRRQISAPQRNQIVIDAFATAGERLRVCGSKGGSTSSEPSDRNFLNARWAEMKPLVNTRSFRRNPDLADAAMDLVFSIEQQTASTCAAPRGKDLALLLISHLREGS